MYKEHNSQRHIRALSVKPMKLCYESVSKWKMQNDNVLPMLTP